jgi:hypothetical protein
MTVVRTSYNPFDFSKVAYGHDLSRRARRERSARNLQAG